MVLFAFSGGSSSLISSHNSSGIFLIAGRCFVLIIHRYIERTSQAICLSTIFGIGSNDKNVNSMLEITDLGKGIQIMDMFLFEINTTCKQLRDMDTL